MKAIILRAEVWRSPHADAVIVDYRWHCRICDKSGRVHSYRWQYIARLGLGHLERNHEPEETP